MGELIFELNKIESEVEISGADTDVKLNGILGLPQGAKAVILFAHGSGSGRFSPRNNYVARILQQAGFGTLLMDLLSEDEAADRSNVFDIGLLAERLNLAKHWISKEEGVLNKIQDQFLKIGYFGASTGAGAALVAAAQEPNDIFAVVSRGGRPDLAKDYLKSVRSPTLLLVGGNDDVVIDLNKEALQKLTCKKELRIIPGATHLFEEPGTLELVADYAKGWFLANS